MRRTFIWVLVGILLLGLIPTASAEAGKENFKRSQIYTAGQFADVKASDWFAEGVQSAFELGLMKGSGETTFKPTGNLTVGEALAIACRLHSIYAANGQTFTQGSPWYQVYVDYAIANGIMKAGQLDPKKTITREQFAYLMCGALPKDELKTVNVVLSIPDEAEKSEFGSYVYRLYRAGVLAGSDKNGTFRPTTAIQRSEVATIVTRMADKSQRKNITLSDPAAEEQFTKPLAKLDREDFTSYVDGFEPGMLDIDTGAPKNVSSFLRTKEYFTVPRQDVLYFSKPANTVLFIFRYHADGTLSEYRFYPETAETGAYTVYRKYKYKLAYRSVLGVDVTEKNLAAISGQLCAGLLSDSKNDAVYRNRDKDAAMLELLRANETANGRYKPLTFAHFSDVHSQQIEWNDICTYLDEWDHVIQFGIHTGDMAGNSLESLTNFYTVRMPKKLRIFNVVGNHDTYKTDKMVSSATQAEVYSALFAPADPASWGVTFGDGENVMYYHKDFPEQGIRLIVIDPYYWNDREDGWLDRVLNEAKEKDLAVITAAHERGAEVESVGSTFYPTDPFTRKLTETDFYPNIARFVKKGGTHVVHLSGHFHHDKFGLTKDGILVSQVECATHYNHQTDTVRERDPYKVLQKSYDCFDIVQVDRSKGLIKIVRIGVNQNKHGAARNTLCYDYVNGELISNT